MSWFPALQNRRDVGRSRLTPLAQDTDLYFGTATRFRGASGSLSLMMVKCVASPRPRRESSCGATLRSLATWNRSLTAPFEKFAGRQGSESSYYAMDGHAITAGLEFGTAATERVIQ